MKKAKRARSAPKSEINEAWFRTAIEDCGKTQVELSGQLGITAAQVSKLLQGDRRVQLYEVDTIARFLGKSNADVLTNLGVKLAGGGAGGRPVNGISVPLVGHIEADGTATIDLDHPSRMIDAPGRVPTGTVAIAASSPHHNASNLLIGGTFFVQITDRLEPAAVGRLSLVRLEKGPWLLRTVKPSVEYDTYDLIGPMGTMEGQRVIAGSPVLLIRP